MNESLLQFFGPIEAWSRRFDIPVETLRLRLKEASIVEFRWPYETTTRAGYRESDVRRSCADLIDSHTLTIPAIVDLPDEAELMTDG